MEFWEEVQSHPRRQKAFCFEVPLVEETTKGTKLREEPENSHTSGEMSATALWSDLHPHVPHSGYR